VHVCPPPRRLREKKRRVIAGMEKGGADIVLRTRRHRGSRRGVKVRRIVIQTGRRKRSRLSENITNFDARSRTLKKREGVDRNKESEKERFKSTRNITIAGRVQNKQDTGRKREMFTLVQSRTKQQEVIGWNRSTRGEQAQQKKKEERKRLSREKSNGWGIGKIRREGEIERPC